MVDTNPSVHLLVRYTDFSGMAKAVADVNLESQGGFASNDGNITGFSHMHDSGTGGVSHFPSHWEVAHLLTKLGLISR